MEFQDQRNGDESDRFVMVMKNNAVLDCRIIQLKSHINTLKTELKDLERQLSEEKDINKRLTAEADIIESCELQTRTRLSDLNQSKKLIAKLCSDLREQVNLEKRRSEEIRVSHNNSMKSQEERWEEYQKLYRSFPCVKDLEKTEIELKKIEIEKKIKLRELDEFKKKVEAREQIEEKRQQILQKELQVTKSKNKELVKKKEELINQRVKEETLIEKLKQEKNEILAHIKKGSESTHKNQTKHAGDSYSVDNGILQQSFETTGRTQSITSDLELPELPQLQLPQMCAPSRKIRRIDMVDITLKRPSFVSFSQPKPISQPVNQNNQNRRSPLSNISSLSQNIHLPNMNRNNIYQNHEINKNRTESNKENSMSQHSAPNQCHIVKPMQIVNTATHFENDRFDNSAEKNYADQGNDNLQNDKEMGYCFENNDDVDKNIDEPPNVEEAETGDAEGEREEEEEEENITESPEGCCDSFGDQDKNDDGYYSQSISSQSQLTQSQRMQSPLRHNNNRNEHHAENSSQKFGSVNVVHGQQSSKGTIQRASSTPSTSTSSTISQESQETQSRYFMKRKNETRTQMPTSQSLQSRRTIFKSPPPPSMARSTITSQSVPSSSATSGFFSQKESQNSSNFTLVPNQQKATNDDRDERKDFLMSPQRDSLSPWAKSPSPPHGLSMRSPPDMPSFSDSYLNLLSPPGRPAMRDQGNSDEPPPRPMNMFGGPKTQTESTSGFSFASKLPTTSSLFSMFK